MKRDKVSKVLSIIISVVNMAIGFGMFFTFGVSSLTLSTFACTVAAFVACVMFN